MLNAVSISLLQYVAQTVSCVNDFITK